MFESNCRLESRTGERFLFIKGIKQLLKFSCTGHGKSHFTFIVNTNKAYVRYSCC